MKITEVQLKDVNLEDFIANNEKYRVIQSFTNPTTNKTCYSFILAYAKTVEELNDLLADSNNEHNILIKIEEE